MSLRLRSWTVLWCVLLAGAMLVGQDLASFEKHVTEFTLANGMHFIVLERHEAPVVSFVTWANVGSVDDPKGETGLAHMFEHMAFKGTTTIGTTNWPKEKVALAAEDAAYEALEAERRKGLHADAARVKQLQADFGAKQKLASSYVVDNEYPRLIEANGGVGLNAFTSEDATVYFYSLPSNRAELWFYLESERFLHPVFREFYKERDVVREERRMRTESNPQGQLIEDVLGASYLAHPYKNPAVGWPSDVENLTLREADRFYQAHYGPNNLTAAIVGDVDPVQVQRWATAYFGRLQRGPAAQPVVTVEPPQTGARRIEVVSSTQPILLVTYHRPAESDPDRAVFDVISSLLSDGRTSWLYRSLVRDKKLALFAGGFANFPGVKYPELFVFYDVPAPGHDVDENLKGMDEQIDRLRTTPVDAATLQMVKTKNRAALVRQLDNNAGLAQELASNSVIFGDWRQLFRAADEVDRVTAADVLRVARAYFQPQMRTIGYLVKPPAALKPPPAATPGTPAEAH